MVVIKLNYNRELENIANLVNFHKSVRLKLKMVSLSKNNTLHQFDAQKEDPLS